MIGSDINQRILIRITVGGSIQRWSNAVKGHIFNSKKEVVVIHYFRHSKDQGTGPRYMRVEILYVLAL